jgi:hypothetical protein
MRQSRKLQPVSEPIGIVIADGGAPATETRFSAFVWGPVPDTDDEILADRQLLAAAV